MTDPVYGYIFYSSCLKLIKRVILPGKRKKEKEWIPLIILFFGQPSIMNQYHDTLNNYI
jgi:hypothetical protein